MQDVLMIIAAFFGGVIATVVGEWLKDFRRWEVGRVLVAAELGENVIKASGLVSARLPLEEKRGLYATDAWFAHRGSFVSRMAVIDADYFAILSGLYARLDYLNRSGEAPEPEFIKMMDRARRRLWGYKPGRIRTLYLRVRTYRRRKQAPAPIDRRNASGFPGHGTGSQAQEHREQEPPGPTAGAAERDRLS